MNKAKKMRRYALYLFCGLAVMSLSFRYTPLLFPIKHRDLQRDHFHSVKFYDRHGNLLQEVLSADSRRSVHVNLNNVSPYFIDAIIATEDKDFHKHSGVDYSAVLRAALQNLKAQRVVSGASTITWQLARLLQPGERTIIKKIKEAYFAFRLEAGMSKTEILEEYINRLPMSGNFYGVESAAKAYFGIPASDLTLAQAAFLASIPNSPKRLNPYHNLSEIKKRQQIVLQRMVKGGMIERERVPAVGKEDILLKSQRASFRAPHFVFSLLDELPQGATTVRTTIDSDLQRLVTEQVNKVLATLKDRHVTNASALLLDNETGEVLAYVGSADYFNHNIDGEYDGVRALRQPGSALKPFLYLLAMEQGLNPASLLSDIPTHYTMPTGVYSPKNYSESFHGPIRLREALANSLNVPAVRVLARVGIEPFLQRLREYGFTSLDQEADYYGIGMALGGGEVTLYELTRAYMCLARMGRPTPTQPVLAVDGTEIKPASSEHQQRISTEALNYLISHILNDPHARTGEFGFDSVLNLPFECSVKTGTSFRFSDNWTVGFTKDYTLGVWVGNFDHSPMQKVSGVTGAGPIFARIMHVIYENQEWPEKRPKPDGILIVRVCPTSGKQLSPACPTGIEELIPERDFYAFQKQACHIHRRSNQALEAVFPKEYRPWASELGLKTEVLQATSDRPLRLVNPKDGAIYHRLSNLAPEFQSIKFEIESDVREPRIKWFLNETYLATTEGEHSILWQIKPGDYTLRVEAVAENKPSSHVQFQVK